MDHQVKNFISLLSSVVNGGETCLTDDIEWGAVLQIAAGHNIFPLIVEKASEFESFLMHSQYKFYLTEAISQVAGQTRRTAEFLRIYQYFASCGLYPIVMKGIVCRQMYGAYCDHRPSCDEDILIKKEDYRRAEKLLNDCGYFPDRNDIRDDCLETVQEVTFRNCETQLHIELHINPIGNDNEMRSLMNECFKDVFDHDCELDINGVSLHVMTYTDSFLYFIFHAFRHFTAGGFGIRQVVDILLYEKMYHPFFDWEYIENNLKKFNAWLFLSDLIDIGNQFLGFDLPELSPPTCPDALFEDLIGNGVFGNATQAQRTAYQMTSAAVAGNHKESSKHATMLRTIFPGRDQMLSANPELQQKPWLLPIKWVQRWGRFLQHSRENEGNLAKESMEIGKRRIELMKKYGII